MYILKPGIKEDPIKRWNLSDRTFFACGACHILAHAFLEKFPKSGFLPIWIRPKPGYTGNHVFVTDGRLVFDYHGFSDRQKFLEHYFSKARRLFPGWDADLIEVTTSLISREDSKTIGMDIRGPEQYLYNALPRASYYLNKFDFSPINSSVERGNLHMLVKSIGSNKDN
jgi:hypothetical protein